MGTSIQKSTSFFSSVSDSLSDFRTKIGHLSTEMGLHTVAWLKEMPSSLQSINPSTFISFAVANINAFIATIILTGQMNNWIDENKNIPDPKTKTKIKFIADVCLATFTSYSANTLVSKISHTPINQLKRLLISAGSLTFYLFLFWKNRPPSLLPQDKNKDELIQHMPSDSNTTKINDSNTTKIDDSNTTKINDSNTTKINDKQKKRKPKTPPQKMDGFSNPSLNISVNSNPKNKELKNKELKLDSHIETHDISRCIECSSHNFTPQTATYKELPSGEKGVMCPHGSFHVVSPRSGQKGNEHFNKILKKVDQRLAQKRDDRTEKKEK